MKVVDLLFVYNFYFGQISCLHMKFGVSASRFRVQIIQNLSLGFTVPLLFLYCARHGVFAGHTGDCARRRRFHASAIASERRSSPHGRPRSFPGRPNPPFSSSVHDEPSSSGQHRANPSSSSSAPAVVPRAPILPNPDPPCPPPPPPHPVPD